jgi:hypothetical protein
MAFNPDFPRLSDMSLSERRRTSRECHLNWIKSDQNYKTRYYQNLVTALLLNAALIGMFVCQYLMDSGPLWPLLIIAGLLVLSIIETLRWSFYFSGRLSDYLWEQAKHNKTQAKH